MKVRCRRSRVIEHSASGETSLPAIEPAAAVNAAYHGTVPSRDDGSVITDRFSNPELDDLIISVADSSPLMCGGGRLGYSLSIH